MRFSRRHSVLIACLSVACFPTLALGDDAGAKRLADLAKTYRDLKAYADHGEVTIDMTVNGKPFSFKTPHRVQFSRPNKLVIETDDVRLVSDGTTLVSVLNSFRKFLKAAAPLTLSTDVLSEGPIGVIFQGHLSGAILTHPLNLLLAPDAAKLITDQGYTPTVEPDHTINKSTYQVLKLSSTSTPSLRFLIDPKTGFLAMVEMPVPDEALKKDAVPGRKVEIKPLRWSAGAIETKEIPADTFAFKPPAGYETIVKLEELAEPGEAAPKNPLIGKPAPEFSLTIFDGPGKTKRIKRADLAGKVVMIDFWATWCGPCLKELPEVQKLIEGYDKARKGVTVLAVSLDEPEDGGFEEARTLVEKTLKERKIELLGNSVGLIGIDPTGTIGRAYGASAIPMTVILDRDGVVQAVHVGYTERDVFEQEINTLLEGKSLIKADDKK